MNRVRNVSKPSPAAQAVIQGLPPLSFSVLPSKELDKIHAIVEGQAQADAAYEADRKNQLRDISKARVANWPNTIEAQRLKKERVRKERFEEEEARRRVIDEQEAQLAAAKQAEAIRKANMLLYEQNDRIKTFSSKLFLATVLEEREKQLKFKEERDAAAREAEARLALEQAAALREAEEAELHKQKSIHQRTFDLKKSQLQQLADIRVVKIKQRDDNQAEGLMIKQQVEAAIQEEIEQETVRRERQKVRAKELVHANTAVREVKLERRRQEETEEQKILEFAQLKEQQAAERKRRVEEKHHAKLSRRQALIDRQAQLLLELQQATEEREMKAMRDFDAERAVREEREEAARQRRQKEIEDFRIRQQEIEKHRKDAEMSERERMKKVWAVRTERLIDEELAERRDRRQTLENLQRMHLLQAHEKRMQDLYEKRQAFEEGIHVQNALKEEQQAYEGYVNSVMQDYVANGRNSELVQVAVRKARRINTA